MGQGVELALGERRLGDRVLLRVGPAMDHPRRNRQRNKALPYQALRKVTASIESGHGRKAYRESLAAGVGNPAEPPCLTKDDNFEDFLTP